MKVSIVGTRGVPARHGGFETFAEHLSLYLVARGHEAVVYCQGPADEPFYEDEWCGVKRVHIPAADGPRGTITFDLQSVWHSASTDGVILTLGYNTAIFSLFYRLKNVPHVMNMDGIEWKRDKCSSAQRAWLWANEFLGAQLANIWSLTILRLRTTYRAILPREDYCYSLRRRDAVVGVPGRSGDSWA
jgi:Domain of unknown function (DUF1972)